MKRKRTILPILSLLATLLASSPALAQTARFTGRVVDPGGNPIADVQITLHNLEDGQVVQIESDDDGRFFRRALTIGRYEALFEKAGYVSIRDQVRLGTGQTRHDVEMVPATITTVGPEASPEYKAAYHAFTEGDRAGAIEILDGLVREAPDFVPAILLRARAHFELEHWQEAIDGYQRVIELQPDVEIAYLDLGVAYGETGEIDKATAAFQKALELAPEDAEIHYNIGTVYVRADRVDEAIEHLTRATELDPEHALAHKALAFALARRSDTEGAIRHLERYLELAPDAPDAAEMRDLLEQLRGS